ncbi:serine--tRNA ligase, mitochondrial [Lucilia sericata]|uniref:serine--tRNA ligase, mitochondrial n=1 Tax=Lucilia sericata TaxID=13632 RepID=UPI0018A81D1C|nr:serine--tRNA ligase, mitochondrial [Lucilia sericata]
MRFLPFKKFVCRSSNLKYKTDKSHEIAQYLKDLDWSILEKSLLLRGISNNISYLRKLVNNIDSANDNDLNQLEDELLKLPNYVHPRVWNYGSEVKEIFRFNPENTNKGYNIEFSEMCKNLNIFRMDHLGNYTGHKSYYLLGKLAEMEQALIQLSIDVLKKNGFNLLSVPDILPKDIIEGCGMQTDGDRTQVYKIESGKCLSGTAEMAIAGFFSNRILKESELPIKCAAVSRCYRAETSGLNEEKGIYRVHQFTKVEMFTVCSQNQSEHMLESFKDLEMDLFKKLNLNFRLLDMPPTELGASAYQKYDIESWMPGRKLWGEISSCSNCTDYQSKRLNIKYIANNGDVLYAHTVNGTASAIPRLLISLIESNQVDKSTVKLPDILLNYMRKSNVSKERNIPEIKLVKHIKSTPNV